MIAVTRQSFGAASFEDGDEMAKGKYPTHVLPKLILVEAWARDGLTLDQIARNLGISKQTLNEYRKEYPDFSDALKRGREVIDVMVENALLKAAMGYEYEEDAVTQKGVAIRLNKVAHPNVTALIFWLKNRRPGQWRDKQEVTHDASDSFAALVTDAWNRMNSGKQ